MSSCVGVRYLSRPPATTISAKNLHAKAKAHRSKIVARLKISRSISTGNEESDITELVVTGGAKFAFRRRIYYR